MMLDTVRCGIGYDVHAFGPKRKLMLGGVRIPSLVGLEGHSDADVLLHAICDALLGAAALGDIGIHFPDTKKKFKNIPSRILLKQVSGMLTRRGYVVNNIDATVILEEPKIARYVGRMRKSIRGMLGIGIGKISIKATTSEGLGFVGRREGCAAMAIATIHLTSGNRSAGIHR